MSTGSGTKGLAALPDGALIVAVGRTDVRSASRIGRHLGRQWVEMPCPARHEDFQRAVEALDQGSVVIVFPEGGPHHDHGVFRAHPDVASLALQTGAPVVPAGLIRADFGVVAAMRGTGEIVTGPAMDFTRYSEPGQPSTALDGWILRTMSDQIALAIAQITRRPYRDTDARPRTYSPLRSVRGAWEWYRHFQAKERQRKLDWEARLAEEAELAAQLDEEDLNELEAAALAAAAYAQQLALMDANPAPAADASLPHADADDPADASGEPDSADAASSDVTDSADQPESHKE